MMIRVRDHKGKPLTLDLEKMELRGNLSEQTLLALTDDVGKKYGEKAKKGFKVLFKGDSYYGTLKGKKETGNRILKSVKDLEFDFETVLDFLSVFDFRASSKKMISGLGFYKNFLKYDLEVAKSYKSFLAVSGIDESDLGNFILNFKKYKDYFKTPEMLAIMYYANKYNLINAVMDCFTDFSHFKALTDRYVNEEMLGLEELEKAIDCIKYHFFIYGEYPKRLPKNLLSNTRKFQKIYELKTGEEKKELYLLAVERFKQSFKTVDDEVYYIDFLETVEELSREGSEMNHCVFSYLNDVIKWRSNIFSIRERASKKRVGTIQIVGDSIVQYKARNNYDIKKEVMEYLKRISIANKLTIK